MTDAARSLSGKPTRLQWLMLVGIIALAVVLRFIFISDNEAHFDEIWHLELSTGRGSAHLYQPLNQLIPNAPDLTSLTGAPPWYAVPGSLRDDTHPPAHYLLLRFWRSIFGQSLTVGRMMSAFISVLCVILLFDTARQLHPVSTALWAALLLSLSSAQIQLAQEVRGYSLLVLLSLVAADALLRIERCGLNRRRGAALTVGMLGMLFTHYFAMPVILSIVIYAMLRLERRAWRFVLVSAVSSCIVFAAAWGPMLWQQRGMISQTGGQGAYLENVPNHIQLTFERFAEAPLRLIFPPRTKALTTARFSIVILLLPWLMLRQRPQLLLWGLWLTLVIGFVATIDLVDSTRQLSEVRQTLVAGPALCMVLVLIAAPLRPLLANGVPAIVAIASISALGLSYDRSVPARLSEIGRYLSAARGTDEPVVVYLDPPPYAWLSEWLYLAGQYYSGVFPRPAALIDRPASPELIAQLRHWRGAWVIFSSSNVKPTQALPGSHLVSLEEEPRLGVVAHVEWNDLAASEPATNDAVADAPHPATQNSATQP